MVKKMSLSSRQNLKGYKKGRSYFLFIFLFLFTCSFFICKKEARAEVYVTHWVDNVSISLRDPDGVPWFDPKGQDFNISCIYYTRTVVTWADEEGNMHSSESLSSEGVNGPCDSVSPASLLASDYGKNRSFSVSANVYGITVSSGGTFRVRGPKNEIELKNAINRSTSADTLYLDSDIGVGSGSEINLPGKPAVLDGNGRYRIYRASGGADALISISSGNISIKNIRVVGNTGGTSAYSIDVRGGTLTLSDCDISGGHDTTILVRSGSLYIKKGTVIENGTCRTATAILMGLNIDNSDTFLKMEDGIIYGAAGEGNVTIFAGNFEMTGGTINAYDRNNNKGTLTTNVHITKNPYRLNTFYMTGGSLLNSHEGIINDEGERVEIRGGYIETGSMKKGVTRSAACIANLGDFYVKGGTFVTAIEEDGTSFINYGGNAYIEGGDFYQKGEKTGNGIINVGSANAYLSGGKVHGFKNGLYQDGTGDFIIGNGDPLIYENGENGIIILSGAVKMNKGTVYKNSKAGVMINKGTSFYQSGGTIKENTVSGKRRIGIYQSGNLYLSSAALCDEENSIALDKDCIITITSDNLVYDKFKVGILNDSDNYVGRTIALLPWNKNSSLTNALKNKGEYFSAHFSPDFLHPLLDESKSAFSGCKERNHPATIRPGTCGSRKDINTLYLSAYYTAFYDDFPVKNINPVLPDKECFLWKEEYTFLHTDIEKFPVKNLPDFMIMKGYTINSDYKRDNYKYFYDTVLKHSLGDTSIDYPENEKPFKYYDKKKTLLQSSDLEFGLLSGNFYFYPVFDIKQDILYLGGDTDRGETVLTMPLFNESILTEDNLPLSELWDYRRDDIENFYRRISNGREDHDYSIEGWSFVKNTILSDKKGSRMKYSPGLFTHHTGGNMTLRYIIEDYDTDLFGLSFYAEGVKYKAADDVLFNGTKPLVKLYAVFDRFPELKACEMSIDKKDIDDHDEQWLKNELLSIPDQIYYYDDRETDKDLLKISLYDFNYAEFKNVGLLIEDMKSIPVTYRIEDTAKGLDKEGNVSFFVINVSITSSSPLRSKEKMYEGFNESRGIIESRFINKEFFDLIAESEYFKAAKERDKNIYYTKEEYEKLYKLYEKGALHPYSKWYTDEKLFNEIKDVLSRMEE